MYVNIFLILGYEWIKNMHIDLYTTKYLKYTFIYLKKRVVKYQYLSKLIQLINTNL